MLLLDEGHCLRDHALQACSKETIQKIDAFKAKIKPITGRSIKDEEFINKSGQVVATLISIH